MIIFLMVIMQVKKVKATEVGGSSQLDFSDLSPVILEEILE